jgi:hypothetical protein
VTDGPSADRSINARNNNNSNNNITVMSLLKQPAGRAIDSGLMESCGGAVTLLTVWSSLHHIKTERVV